MSQQHTPNATVDVTTVYTVQGKERSRSIRNHPAYVTTKRVLVLKKDGRTAERFDRQTGKDVGAYYALSQYIKMIDPASITLSQVTQ